MGRRRTPCQTEGQRRLRAAYACRICRGRKVKCDLGETGPPCGYCRRDGLKCEVAASRGYRALAWNHRFQVSQQMDNPIAEKEPDSADDLGRDARDVVGDPDLGPDCHTSNCVPAVRHDKSETGIANAAAVGEMHGREDTIPVYIGDRRSLGFITESSGTVDLGHGSNKSHCLVPRPSLGMPPQEDLDFLLAKGVFQLPDKSVVVAILQCYFAYVHPLFPIINPTEFLEQYESDGPLNTSLLLLWSMMFAAGSFLDDSLLAASGYKSRTAIRLSMYAKAKALYDTDFEKEKIPLIQSTILLGFWNANVEDRTGPWHWNGVAISLCQSMGMHRAIKPNHISGRLFTQGECRLWSLIWWTCYSRETWLSLILGRPMRINTADCDMPFPSVADAEEFVTSLSDSTRQKYFPGCITNLLHVWGRWLKLTLCLGEILSTYYRPNMTRAPIHEVERKEEEIRESHSEILNGPLSKERLFLLYQYQIELSLEAVITTLYRPYILDAGITKQPETSFRSVALHKSRMAASNSSTVLNKLISADMIPTCQTYTLAALMVIMQSHLIEFASPTSLHRMVAQSQFDFCMAVLEEMQKTYWAASFAMKFFFAAQKKLQSPRPGEGNRPPESAGLFVSSIAGTPNPDEIEQIFRTGLFDQLSPFSSTMATMNIAINPESSGSTNSMSDFDPLFMAADFQQFWDEDSRAGESDYPAP